MPNSTRPPETRSSVATRSATRAGMVEARRDLHDAVPEPDVLGALAGGGEEHLGRARVRVLLEEVVLDLPDVVDADPVGELDLLERVVQQPLLGVLGPGPRQLVLVEDAESHLVAPLRSVAAADVGLRRAMSNSGRRRAVGVAAAPIAGDSLGDDPAALLQHRLQLLRRRGAARSGRRFSAITPVHAPHMNLAARYGSTGRAAPVFTPSSMIAATRRTCASARSRQPLRRERQVVLGPRVDVREGQDPEVAGMVEIEAQVRPAGGEQLLAERQRRLEGLLHVALLHVERALDQGQVEALLALEVDVDRAHRDVGRVGDLLDGRAVKAVLRGTASRRRRRSLDGAGLAALDARKLCRPAAAPESCSCGLGLTILNATHQ